MPESDGDLQQAREVFIALIRQAHAGARRRSAIDFREISKACFRFFGCCCVPPWVYQSSELQRGRCHEVLRSGRKEQSSVASIGWIDQRIQREWMVVAGDLPGTRRRR